MYRNRFLGGLFAGKQAGLWDTPTLDAALAGPANSVPPVAPGEPQHPPFGDQDSAGATQQKSGLSPPGVQGVDPTAAPQAALDPATAAAMPPQGSAGMGEMLPQAPPANNTAVNPESLSILDSAHMNDMPNPMEVQAADSICANGNMSGFASPGLPSAQKYTPRDFTSNSEAGLCSNQRTGCTTSPAARRTWPTIGVRRSPRPCGAL